VADRSARRNIAKLPELLRIITRARLNKSPRESHH
jgi:hypothetical protein